MLDQSDVISFIAFVLICISFLFRFLLNKLKTNNLSIKEYSSRICINISPLDSISKSSYEDQLEITDNIDKIKNKNIIIAILLDFISILATILLLIFVVLLMSFGR